MINKTSFAYAFSLLLSGLASMNSTHAQSNDEFFDIGFGGSAYFGTTGLGAQGTMALNNNISMSAGYDFAALDYQFDDVFDVPYTDGAEVEFSLSTPYVMAGFHPFANDIRFGAGLAFPDFSGKGTFSYDGSSYDGDLNLALSNDSSVAPVLTLGFVQSPRGGIGFYSEVGLMFMGDLSSTLTAQDTCGANAACSSQRQDLLNDAQADIDYALSYYGGVYPIGRFGVQIAF